MNKQEQIKILEKELEMAENYPFYSHSKARVSRAFYRNESRQEPYLSRARRMARTTP